MGWPKFLSQEYHSVQFEYLSGPWDIWRSIPAKIQCCILHSTFRILSYICYLTSEFTLSSFNIHVFALYIHLFVRNIQVRVQVQRVALSSFRIQCWAFANQVFAFNILYVFHLQVCIVHSTFQTVLFIRWSSTKDKRWAQLTQPTLANE